jgi:hypothetical protein
VLAKAPDGRGGTWNQHGVILFADNINTSLKRVPEDGGAVTEAIPQDLSHNEASQRFPQFWPDGLNFTFTAIRADKQGLYVGALDSTDRKLLLPGKWGSPTVVGEYLLGVNEGSLVAHALDLKRLATTGDRIEIADRIAWGSPSGLAAFSASRNGTLVYSTGTSANRQLKWFHRNTQATETVGSVGEFSGPALSRDERLLAVARVDPQTRAPDIWITDLRRGSEMRFTSESSSERAPVWSPDGGRIAFTADRSGMWDVFIKSIHQADHVIGASGGFGKFTSDWSPDGKFLVYHTPAAQTNWDVWVLPVDDPSKQWPILQSRFNEMLGSVAPNGRWLAYTSDETGGPQVYVQSFPDPGKKVRVSRQGGYEPKWASTGDELFFISADRKLMAVEVRTTGPVLDPGVPQELFALPVPDLVPSFSNTYAVAARGQKFLVNTLVHGSASSTMSVVLNWTRAQADK